jgi:selenocysteine lyase/cysteine desulfurase
MDFDPDDCTLGMSGLESVVSKRTRLVRIEYASNAASTINDATAAVSAGHKAGRGFSWMRFIRFVVWGPQGDSESKPRLH